MTQPTQAPERVVRGDYLDPDGGAAAFEELFSLGDQDSLVAAPCGAALSVGCVALSCSCFQSQIHCLVAVETVHGVVEAAAAILGPWGHPLGTAVLVGILCRFCAALGCHRDQRLGGGPWRHRGRCLLVICVGDSCKRRRPRQVNTPIKLVYSSDVLTFHSSVSLILNLGSQAEWARSGCA